MRNIIFLDIDGVLNCEDGFRSGLCSRMDKHGNAFYPPAKELINQLIEETNIPAEHWEIEIGEMMDWYAGYYHQANSFDPNRLKQLVWDGLLTAQHQDEQWSDEDTCRLIVSKILNDGPITYPEAKI